MTKNNTDMKKYMLMFQADQDCEACYGLKDITTQNPEPAPNKS